MVVQQSNLWGLLCSSGGHALHESSASDEACRADQRHADLRRGAHSNMLHLFFLPVTAQPASSILFTAVILRQTAIQTTVQTLHLLI